MNQDTMTIQEDEIDLRELGRTIAKHKKKLFAFVFVATAVTVVFTLSKPNIYTSQTILVPQEQSQGASLGGLGALAGMAGVDLGGGSLSADQAYQLYANDYKWMRKFLLKTKLFNAINAKDFDKNYHFALGYDGIYKLLKADGNTSKEKDEEERLFETYKKVKETLAISSDKKTSAITISYNDPDPVLAQRIVNDFLSYASSSLKESDFADIDKKLSYFQDELQKTNDLSLKTQLSQMMSGLIQKKVLAQASEYYNVKIITPPSIAYEKDKVGPKRGLIVVVAAVTSLILGIFGIFFLEFIRKEENLNE